MRNGLLSGAALVAAVTATALPANASAAACSVPKGWTTANARLAYEVQLFSGSLGSASAGLLSGLGAGSTAGPAVTSFATLTGGRALTVSGAAARYPVEIAAATLDDPPRC